MPKPFLANVCLTCSLEAAVTKGKTYSKLLRDQRPQIEKYFKTYFSHMDKFPC